MVTDAKSCKRAFKGRYKCGLDKMTCSDPAVVFWLKDAGPGWPKGHFEILWPHGWPNCGYQSGRLFFVLCKDCAVENGYIW